MTGNKEKKYGCALLAGGKGSRMGNVNKALLKYRNISFAGHIAREMGKTAYPCYFSSAAYEQPVPDGWHEVRDSVSGVNGEYIGPMGGIYSCLKRAEEDGLDGLFFAPCDAPFYTVNAINDLINYIDDDDCAVFWRSSDGRIQTAFGWYSVRCLSQMESDIKKGHYKLICLITVYSGCGTNALIDIPAGNSGLDTGERVSVLLI